MKSKNICKFSPSISRDELEVINFIYETNHAVITADRKLRHHCIYLILQGEGNMVFNKKNIPFGPGMLIFGFSGEEFCVIADPPVEYMYISFNGARAEVLFRRFGINHTCRSFSGFEGILPMWKSCLSRTVEANIDLAAEGVLLYTLSKFDASHARGNEVIQQIVDLTEEHFTDHELTISAIAEELGYNSKYLSHLFKEKMGINHSEYLRNMRIEYAVSLFDNQLQSVKNVAFLSGFKDPLYFSTVFKKTVGVSPKDYMNELQSASPKQDDRM